MEDKNLPRKHGHCLANGRVSPEYRAWNSMRQRCGNPNNSNYPRYGARGITVCERWLNSFEHFFSDMGRRPSPAYSVERVDNNGNYDPSNCRWATRVEQCRNMRSNVLITIGGATRLAVEWADVSPVSYQTILQRHANGWDGHSAVFTPASKANRVKPAVSFNAAKWFDYRMWYRPINMVANNGCSAGWLGEWKPTDRLFRARSQAEAQKKADKFWRDAQYGSGSMLCVLANEDLRQRKETL